MHLRRIILMPLAFATVIWPAASSPSAAHGVETTAHTVQSPYQQGWADGYAGGYARAWNFLHVRASLAREQGRCLLERLLGRMGPWV